METISESELSINEDQLNTFNEFMIAQEKHDQQKELNNQVRQSWKQFPFPANRMSRISADPAEQMLHVNIRKGTAPGNGQGHHIFATFSHDDDEEVLINGNTLLSEPQIEQTNLENNLNNISDIQNVQNTTNMNLTNIIQQYANQDESSLIIQRQHEMPVQRNNDSSYCDESAFGMHTQNDNNNSYLLSNQGNAVGATGMASRILCSNTTSSGRETTNIQPPVRA